MKCKRQRLPVPADLVSIESHRTSFSLGSYQSAVVLTKAEMRRKKNRESAERSRQRKLGRIDDLTFMACELLVQYQDLMDENAILYCRCNSGSDKTYDEGFLTTCTSGTASNTLRGCAHLHQSPSSRSTLSLSLSSSSGVSPVGKIDYSSDDSSVSSITDVSSQASSGCLCDDSFPVAAAGSVGGPTLTSSSSSSSSSPSSSLPAVVSYDSPHGALATQLPALSVSCAIRASPCTGLETMVSSVVPVAAVETFPSSLPLSITAANCDNIGACLPVENAAWDDDSVLESISEMDFSYL
mmetsp:Transcript_26373/g.44524  ORF Transcript_26373/g.44524 Transcript_26373/m.44524 type:complete len:297 (-) Transcript_26373:1980-2870(-)